MEWELIKLMIAKEAIRIGYNLEGGEAELVLMKLGVTPEDLHEATLDEIYATVKSWAGATERGEYL